MNTTKTHKSLLKTLPVISMLMAGLTLSPAIAYADKDHGYNKPKYSHDRGSSYRSNDDRKHNRQTYNNSRPLAKQHKPKHHKRNWRGYTSEHRYNRHSRHGHRPYRQPVYVVNDHHYDNRYIGLDRLGFMLGIHTGNFDISFHD